MIKRQWVIGGCLTFWCIVFLLIAVLSPIILSDLLEKKIKDSITLTKSNKEKLWGKVPGDLKVKMFQSFQFFNILNPEDVMNGEQPLIERKNGYVYQEFDDFQKIDWEKRQGKKLVRFHLLRYTKKTNNAKWPSNVTPEDQITQVSVGAFGAWFQLKHLTRQQIALSVLFQIVNAMETSLLNTAYSQVVLPLLGGFRGAFQFIFQPAGISQERAESIWNDRYYGMGLNTTNPVWVQALMENVFNDTFVLTHPITGTISLLWSYFGLSDSELKAIFSGHFKDSYDLATILFYNNYECPDNFETPFNCDPIYLASLQWTFSGVTLFPPFMAKPSISIASVNDTTTGYPELYYFFEETSVRQKYGNYNFTLDDYQSLFFYNRKNNFPLYSKYTLLDVGKMNKFFDWAYKGKFDLISDMLNLGSENKARILWDYINALIDYTALQGRFDPDVYNIDNRGMTQELSIGVLGSQTLYSLLVEMSETLPLGISSIYNLQRIFQDNLECTTAVSEILSSENATICSTFELEWSPSSDGISQWISTYWSDVNSTSWWTFQNLSQLTYPEMLKLFKTSNNLTKNFEKYDLELKVNYKCENIGPRCDPMFLAKMQWGQSLVTNNLPSILQKIHVKNSTTITNYQNLSMGLKGTPEYSSFIKSRNIDAELSLSSVDFLLSFEGILNPLVIQKFFLFEFERNYEGQKKLLKIEMPEAMIEYLRYTVDLYALGGLIKTKTVNQILFADYTEPLLSKSKYMSPLLGGNPSINLNSTSLAQNMTQDHFKNISEDMRDGMDTGEQDSSEVRRYRLYGGKTYINFLNPAYLGESSKGPVISYVNYNPWPEEIQMIGTDGWAFKPYLTKHTNLKFFLDVAGLIFSGNYDKKTTQRGFECLRFNIGKENFQNVSFNKENAKYNAYAPNGLINFTGVLTAPLFGSKPYYLDADKTLRKLINYSDPSQVKPEKYESYSIIEKHTGADFKGMMQVQFNSELKPDMLYPKLGLYNLKEFGMNTYMPMMFLQRYIALSQSTCDKYFGIIHVISTVILVAQIVGYVLAGIFVILLVIYIWRQHRKSKIKNESEYGHSLMIK